MINFLLYLVGFVFGYKKEFSIINLDYIYYLLFPSLVLYSSVALRDMLIFIIMFVAVYYVLNKRYLLVLVLSCMLILVKVQNFLILVLALVVNYILKEKDENQRNGVYLFLFYCIYVF